MSSGQQIASLYASIGADTSGLSAGLKRTKDELQGASDSFGKFSSQFTGQFRAALSRGSASMTDFAEQLLDAGENAGLSTREIAKLAAGTGVFSSTQLAAAASTRTMAAKASELANAVKSGAMTTREASAAWKQFAATQVVVGQSAAGGAQTLQNLAGAAGKIAMVLGPAAVAATALKMAVDFSQEGAQFARLQTAGQQLAAGLGASFGEIVAKLKEASNGTVAEVDLITAANRAMMLGLSADAGQLADLMQVAAFRGRAMGVSTTQAFNDIVTGVGRMSPMILDNLGIVIDAEKAYQQYATAHGIAASAIDGTTKKQILLNSVITEGKSQITAAGGVAEDSAGKFERMGAAWKDFITMTSQRVEAAPIVQAVTGVLQVETALQGAILQGTMSRKEAIGVAQSYVTGQLSLAEVLQLVADHTGEGATETGMLANAMKEGKAAAKDYSGALQNIKVPVLPYDSMSKVKEEALAAATALRAQQDAAQQLSFTNSLLSAGLSGELGQAYTTFQGTMTGLREEQTLLTGQMQMALTQGYSPTSEKVMKLNAALGTNKQKQLEAAEAMKQATAAMIYQQAAAGLDADASLALARSMGLISEADYATVSVLNDLKAAYDQNRDGAITAGEGAQQYSQDVAAVNTAVQNLMTNGQAITFENIVAEMQRVKDMQFGTEMQNMIPEGMGALTGDVAINIAGIGDSAGEAGEKLGMAAPLAKTFATPVSTISSKAPTAAEGLLELAGAVKANINPMFAAAKQAQALVKYINMLHSKTIVITTIYKDINMGGGGGTGTRTGFYDRGDRNDPNTPKGGLAMGGPAYANQAYLVGEKGPEIFVPSSNGRVINNRQSMRLMDGDNGSPISGGVTNIYITQNISDQHSAAIATAEIRRMRWDRFNGAMGA